MVHSDFVENLFKALEDGAANFAGKVTLGSSLLNTERHGWLLTSSTGDGRCERWYAIGPVQLPAMWKPKNKDTSDRHNGDGESH